MKTNWSVNTICILILLYVSFLPFKAGRFDCNSLNDDAYISLCYAKNIASGNGFVINHDPPTLGTTTPLFTLTVAGIGRLIGSINFAQIGIYLNVFGWALIPWIIVLFRRVLALKIWEAVIVGLCVITFGAPNIGSETIPFQALLVSAVAFFAARRYHAAGFIVGLLTLCRGEGFLLVPIFAMTLFLREMHGKRWRIIGLAREVRDSYRNSKAGFLLSNPLFQMIFGISIPLLLWVVYAQVTFGYFIPQTLRIKIQQGSGFPMEAQFFGQLVKNIQQWTLLGLRRRAIPGFDVIKWGLVAVGIVTVVMKRRGFLPYIIWCICYTVAYTGFGVPGWFWWYRIPIYWCFTFLSAFGLIYSMNLLFRPLEKIVRRRDVIPGGVATLIVFAVVMLHIPDTNRPIQDPRSKIYRKVSEWMNTNTHPRQSLASTEVGYFGYFTSNRIIDKSGLTMPRGYDYSGNHDWNDFLVNYKPDYFIRGAKCPRGCPKRLIVKDIVYRRIKIYKPRNGRDDYALYKRKKPSAVHKKR